MRKLPVWAMSMTHAPLGFYYNFLGVAMPFMLSARGISTAQIAGISATALSPTFWAFLLSPILDVRFTKKQYAVGMFLVSGLCLGAGTLVMTQLALFTAIMTAGCVATALGGNALAAVLLEIVDEQHFGHTSAWYNIANVGAGGLFASVAMLLLRNTPVAVAASALTLLMLAPLLLFFGFPAAAAPTRAVGETFRTLFRDLYVLMKRRECVLGLIAFLAPGSAFALCNLFSGLGDFYHAPPALVAWAGGAGVAIVCSIGCLIGGPLSDRFSRAHVYIVTGIAGAVIAAVMIVAPHTTAVFLTGMMAYNLVQGINYTGFSALVFEITGKDSPLSGTQIALFYAATNLPIVYMTSLDGIGSAHGGLNGMYATDAVAGLVASIALLFLFHFAARARSAPPRTV